MQQINLYQKELWPQKVPFSGRTMLLVCGLWLAALIAVFGFGRWRQYRLEQALATAKARVVAAGRHLAQLEARYPARTEDPALAKEATRLSAARDGRTALVALLEGERFGNRTGFSPQLLAFARQKTPGLWLRRIELRRGGRELTLEGRALTAAVVPRYLKRLAAESVFSGLEFDTFRLSRPQAAPRQIGFFLQTSESDSAQSR